MQHAPRASALIMFFGLGVAACLCFEGQPAHAQAAAATAPTPPPRTSLENPAVRFTLAEKPYVILQRAGVRAVIVDNSAVDDEILPGHRAGYSGVGSLSRIDRPGNLFVPAYAGLNYEHIHDGTVQERQILFEPRHAPLQLRVIDEHTCELYQPPTPHWKLESVLRYQLLDDGTLEMTLECIPRERTFQHDYLGLFWASYIHQPESLDIHFRGWHLPEGNATDTRPEPVGSLATPTKGPPTPTKGPATPAKGPAATIAGPAGWVRGVTPRHGVLATHLGRSDSREFVHDEQFPLSLVFNRSHHRFAQPWYYGLRRGMAFVQIFRPADQVRLTQSPSGGGQGNPAWDFQFFLRPCQVGRRYQLVMRAMYVEFQSAEQLERASRPHRIALGHSAVETAEP